CSRCGRTPSIRRPSTPPPRAAAGSSCSPGRGADADAVELFRTLGVLLEPPVAAHRPLAELLDLGPPPSAAEHTDLFRFQLYPYASVYLGAEGMLGGEARDRIAGFWRALGLVPPAEPDELTVMLGFYAELAERQ